MAVDGNTKVVGIVGDPVAHSLSPRMHNAAFRALGLNFIYVPFRVRPDELSQAIEGIRALGLVGVNVTVPHKEAVLPHLDRLEEEAQFIGAVNTVLNRDGELWGINTDAPGFLDALQEAGFVPAKKRVAVLGAGGAAKAVGAALALAGAEELLFFNRTLNRAVELAAYLKAGTGVRARALAWDDLPAKGIELLRAADLVVQTTTLGMHPREWDVPPVGPEAFRPGQLVVDLVYKPIETRFLALARVQGARTLNGLGMLLYQGARAFARWTGMEAPLEVMRAALEEVLGVARGGEKNA
ncbi:shikimate dehydrogenase [Desulfothermobacter acidiphilus]|uniref:shikimate dehydrogenase n=1 Tax=Desulfothermobacter acidiphilus TaxID=1938353 RepID=UPI003F8BF37D